MARTGRYSDVDWDPSEMDDKVGDMQHRSDNFKPVFREMKDYLEDAWAGNFLSNGLRVGGWQPLDAKYASWKAVRYPGAQPLVQTGELFRSIRNLNSADVEIGDREASFGTSIEYAKFHQYGTSKMPKREIIFQPEDFERKWGELTARFIADGDTGLNVTAI
jgi:phage gpG-like protein